MDDKHRFLQPFGTRSAFARMLHANIMKIKKGGPAKAVRLSLSRKTALIGGLLGWFRR